MRIINVPKRKIGLKTLENLTRKANDLNVSLFEAIDSGKELEFKKIIERYQKVNCPVFLVVNKIETTNFEKMYPVLDKLNKYEREWNYGRRKKRNYKETTLKNFTKYILLTFEERIRVISKVEEKTKDEYVIAFRIGYEDFHFMKRGDNSVFLYNSFFNYIFCYISFPFWKIVTK